MLADVGKPDFCNGDERLASSICFPQIPAFNVVSAVISRGVLPDCAQPLRHGVLDGGHMIIQRCCRWLLMTQNRVGSNEIHLTHEFLAFMLGVRRARVTETLDERPN